MNAEALVELVVDGDLVAAGRPVVVMLSGGRDSVCLLDVCVRVCGRPAVQALHVNYGLRGDESDADEGLCASLCSRLEVPLRVRAASRPPGGGNLQAWAREVRYEAARELSCEWGSASGPACGPALIATGHTATDQVETILYRLASSPSRRALLGMRARSGSLVRPLLGVTREDTGAYCAERGLAWREDATNSSDAYARGRVRERLMPALRSVHPAAEANVLALAAVLREEAEVLDGLVSEVVGSGDGDGGVELTRLRGLAPALARLVLQRLADEAAGGFAPGTARRWEEVLKLREGGALDLPHGVRAVVASGKVRFECPYNRSQ